MHLAQYNVARFKGDKNGPGMADFHANLDRINALGDRMPGFVWRLKSAEGDNAPVLVVPGAENVAANLTVWESVEALENYVWNTVHAKIYAPATTLSAGNPLPPRNCGARKGAPDAQPQAHHQPFAVMARECGPSS
jgi:hypothetical protein